MLSAAARTSLLLMFAACPGYAAAPTFSTRAARRRTLAGVFRGNFVRASEGGSPPRSRTVAVSVRRLVLPDHTHTRTGIPSRVTARP
jgi:hypothetical protein